MDIVTVDLTSLGAVVALAIAFTHAVKRGLATVPVLSRVPVWVYLVLITGGLTFVANQITQTLVGDFRVLVIDAVLKALMAAGLLEVVRTAGKPLAESTVAKVAAESTDQVRPRMWLLPLLLAGGLTAASCQGLMPVPPSTGAESQEQIRAAAAKALGAIEVAGIIVRDGQQLAIDLHVPEPYMGQIKAAVIAANTEVQQVITDITKATRVATVHSLAGGVIAIVRRVVAAFSAAGNPRLNGLAAALDASLAALVPAGGVQ